MPLPRPRIPSRPRRLAPAVLVALLAGACVGTPIALAATTLEFRDSAPSRIDLGVPEAPMGVQGTIKFKTNGQDRKALAAAKHKEQLLAQGERYRAASLLANQRRAAIQELLTAAQEDQAKLEEEIRARVVDRYKDGEAGDLQFLLSGDGLSDILNRSEIIKGQDARDARMIEDYEVTIQKIQDYESVLAELEELTGDQATRLDDRAARLDDQLVAAKVSHESAPEDEATDAHVKGKGAGGTWYIMDGAFSAQLYLPSGGSNYTGGTRTPARRSTPQQVQQVLSDPRIDLDASGINDVRTFQIDGRLLDAIVLAAGRFGYVKITALKGDHGVYTAGGNVSEHSYGCAADIGTIGHTYITPSSQTPGSEVEQAVLFFNGLGQLTGKPDLAPHQVISLFDLGGATLALGDHGDHIHVGYSC